MMNFKEKLNNYAAEVESALDGYLPEKDNLQGDIYKAMRYSLLGGGKRIRGVLTLVCCELCGGRKEDAMPFAAAIEMVHAYSLIHDDLPAMDDDDMRRGKPSNHIAFGEAMAILAGDAWRSYEHNSETLRKFAGGVESYAGACKCLRPRGNAGRPGGGYAVGK